MASEATTEELLKRLRAAGGNAWDGADVRAELAEMRGTDEALEDDHPSVMELFGLFKDSPEKFGEGFESCE